MLGAVTGSSALTDVTADASTHTLGAWVDLGASPFNARGFWLTGYTLASVLSALDIGTGPDGSTWISRIFGLIVSGANSGGRNAAKVWVPLRVQKGQHVGVRVQSNTTVQVSK